MVHGGLVVKVNGYRRAGNSAILFYLLTGVNTC